MRQRIILIIIEFLKTVDNNKILFKLVTTYQHLKFILYQCNLIKRFILYYNNEKTILKTLFLINITFCLLKH